MKNISIIIPAYNEEKYLPKTLTAINKLHHPDFSFETIVVDSESQDKTSEIAKSLGARIVKCKKISPGWARNIGIKNAKNEIIACIDADTIPDKNWLENIHSYFKDDPNLIGLTGIVLSLEKSFFLRLIFLFFSYVFYPLNYLLGKTIFQGQNFALKKDFFFKSGGLKPHIHSAEDADLGARMGKLGKVIFAKNVVVYTSSRRRKEKPSLRMLLRWQLAYLKLVWGINTGNWEKKPFPAVR